MFTFSYSEPNDRPKGYTEGEKGNSLSGGRGFSFSFTRIPQETGSVARRDEYINLVL